MIPPYLLPHQVHPMATTETTDAYGNTRLVPGALGAPVPAYVQPESVSEDTTEGQVRVHQWRVYLAAVADLDAWSGLVWEGLTYELVGDPERFDAPGGRRHVRLTMRRVGA